jgi:hypothetical protein
VLSVDESREQTRAIHAAQRRRQTLAGLLANEDRQATLALHRNAQSLLQPVHVVNPFADDLTFLDDKTRTRRDHMKYLTLIQAIALLHQHQRPSHEVQHRGKAVRYIEVTESDIRLANDLAHEVLGRTLDELPPQTRRLLGMVHDWVAAECARLHVRRPELRFTRRQIRGATGWGDTQLKVHLGRLAELEYVLAHRVKAGTAHEYELLYAGEGETGQPFLMGLSDTATTPPIHACDDDRAGLNGDRSGAGRPMVAPRPGTGRGTEKAAEGRKSAASRLPGTELPEKDVTPLNGAVLSYPQGASQALPAATL